MHKLFSLKLISKIPRNLSNNTSFHRSISINTSLTHAEANPIHLHSFHLRHPHHFFSHCTTYSTHPWSSRAAASKKIFEFFSNPVLLKRFSANALVPGPRKSLVDGRVGFLKARFQKRSLHFNSSYEYRRRHWQSKLPRLTSDAVIMGLILTNVAVFLMWRFADRRFMMENFMISIDNFRNGRVHTLITSAFSHIDTVHLISNMIGLYFFGMSIGRIFGPEFLLKLYLSGAVAGSVFYLAYHAFMAQLSKRKRMWSTDYSRVPGLGASGAVNAIMLLDIFLFPKNTLYLEFIIPVPAILLGIFLIGKDVLRILEGDTQVSGSAHLGGAMVAAIAWVRIRRGGF